MMTSLFGGRVAEELIFGEDKVTTGAADDIRRATSLARRMVTEFGFSDKLGPLRYSRERGRGLPRPLGHPAQERLGCDGQGDRRRNPPHRRRGRAHRARDPDRAISTNCTLLAKGLLEYETLSADEIRRVIKGERIVRETSASGPAPEEPRPPRPAQLGAAVGPSERDRPGAGAAARRLSASTAKRESAADNIAEQVAMLRISGAGYLLAFNR